MRHAMLIALLILTAGVHTAARQEDFAAASIEDVQQFLRFEIAGGRITDTGWRGANTEFFLETRGVSPPPPPKQRDVRVVSDKYYVRLYRFEPTTRATVEVSFPACYGTVDARMHFEQWGTGSPKGVLVLAKCSSTYDLVASRIVTSRFGGTPGAKANQTIMLDRAAARRYVIRKRAETSDPEIKKNADATLIVLKKLTD